VALFANGLSDQRPDDNFGLGIYHIGISRPLKDDIARLTGATVTPKNENGLEVFYDYAITPAIRVIPSYQHIWNPLTAAVVKNEHGADVFLVRLSLTWRGRIARSQVSPAAQKESNAERISEPLPFECRVYTTMQPRSLGASHRSEMNLGRKLPIPTVCGANARIGYS
jgi:hypothetical protein